MAAPPRPRHDAWARGVAAEQLVEAALIADGWQVLGRNLREGGAELDLVALRDDRLRFVEVKARVDPTIEVTESITRDKQRRIARAADAWLVDHPTPCAEMAVLIAMVDCTTSPWSLTWLDDAFDG